MFLVVLSFLKTDCIYTLEPPRGGGSNEYQHSMFYRNSKKNRFTLHTPVLLYDIGGQGENSPFIKRSGKVCINHLSGIF